MNPPQLPKALEDKLREQTSDRNVWGSMCVKYYILGARALFEVLLASEGEHGDAVTTQAYIAELEREVAERIDFAGANKLLVALNKNLEREVAEARDCARISETANRLNFEKYVAACDRYDIKLDAEKAKATAYREALEALKESFHEIEDNIGASDRKDVPVIRMISKAGRLVIHVALGDGGGE